jgi:hypothetical protein
MSNDEIREIIEVIKQGEKEKGKNILKKILIEESKHEQAILDSTENGYFSGLTNFWFQKLDSQHEIMCD